MRKSILAIGLVSLSMYACTSKKEIVNLPEVKVEAEKTPSRDHYYATYTRKIDIIHTKLAIQLNWDSCFVIGKADLKIKPYFYATNAIELDAKGFKINDVKVNGKKATYTYDQYKLVINLDRFYKKDEELNVAIDYIAMPNRIKVKGSQAILSDKGFYFINPQGKEKYKPREFWTQGETESNSCWFPTVESSSERFSQEIAITVEKDWVSLSNGTLVYSTQNGNNTRTDYWKQDLTHAPYLVMLAGGPFKIYKDKWRNKEVNYYTEAAYAPYAKEIFGNTPEMIEFFSKKLGVEYPWDKYSQIIIRDYVSGAMENTGAVTFFDQMNMTDRDMIDNDNEDIISHELFHHWFGDLVTSESWPNLPLNESFATYGEYLWNEYKYGREEADKNIQNDLNAYLSSAKNNKVEMIRYSLKDREDMFDVNSYQKGGRILHMLRKYVGDDAFFASLKLYLETNQYRPAEIAHLRLAFEEVTGEDLHWFFNDWFLDKGHPELTIKYAYDEANKVAKVTIEQTQDLSVNPLYKLPLDVDVYANGKVERKRIIVDSLKQTFEFASATKPDLINVDAEKALLGTKTDAHSKEEWIFMYKNAPLYLDRMEAVRALDADKADSLIQEFYLNALNDRVNSIRVEAMNRVKDFNPTLKAKALPKLKEMATKDKASNVRAKAIRSIHDWYPTENISALLATAAMDSSYMVNAAVLKVYAKTDSVKAMELAKREENSMNSTMAVAIAELYSKNGDSTANNFYKHYLEHTSGFGPLFIAPLYKTYLFRMNDTMKYEGSQLLYDLASNATIGFVKNSLKTSMKEIANKLNNEKQKEEVLKQIESLEKKTSN